MRAPIERFVLLILYIYSPSDLFLMASDMSLTIFSQPLSESFSPQHHSAKPKTNGSINGSIEVVPNRQVSADQADLIIVKISSDNKNVASENYDLVKIENKIRVRIDSESKEIIVEVLNNKTGEEVIQIPGEERLRLSKRISEYYSLVFNHNRPS